MCNLSADLGSSSLSALLCVKRFAISLADGVLRDIQFTMAFMSQYAVIKDSFALINASSQED